MYICVGHLRRICLPPRPERARPLTDSLHSREQTRKMDSTLKNNDLFLGCTCSAKASLVVLVQTVLQPFCLPFILCGNSVSEGHFEASVCIACMTNSNQSHFSLAARLAQRHYRGCRCLRTEVAISSLAVQWQPELLVCRLPTKPLW